MIHDDICELQEARRGPHVPTRANVGLRLQQRCQLMLGRGRHERVPLGYGHENGDAAASKEFGIATGEPVLPCNGRLRRASVQVGEGEPLRILSDPALLPQVPIGPQLEASIGDQRPTRGNIGKPGSLESRFP